jgi:hypothetical protein
VGKIGITYKVSVRKEVLRFVGADEWILFWFNLGDSRGYIDSLGLYEECVE